MTIINISCGRIAAPNKLRGSFFKKGGSPTGSSPKIIKAILFKSIEPPMVIIIKVKTEAFRCG